MGLVTLGTSPSATEQMFTNTPTLPRELWVKAYGKSMSPCRLAVTADDGGTMGGHGAGCRGDFPVVGGTGWRFNG
jgi:hypothetical protein